MQDDLENLEVEFTITFERNGKEHEVHATCSSNTNGFNWYQQGAGKEILKKTAKLVEDFTNAASQYSSP